jgi:thioredoxin-dependent peroxiredoxin
MTSIKTGKKAPDFALTTDRNETFRLSEHRGSPVVLVFYPQDDTEGCTIENIEFTQLMPEFKKLGAEVVGISPDSVDDHCKFRDKYQLALTLVADPDHEAIDAYGVWGPKSTFGRDYVGLIRTTFLIGPDGKIAGIWRVNRIKAHAADVLEATRSLVAA